MVKRFGALRARRVSETVSRPADSPIAVVSPIAVASSIAVVSPIDVVSPMLPPGGLDSLDDLEKVDRSAIVRRSSVFGPMFTGTTEGELCVCIVGLTLGRRFLQEHTSSLHPRTLELESLIPKGFLRQMGGDDHREYRRAVVRAARSLEAVVDRAVLDALVARGLRDLATSGVDATPASGPSPLLRIAADVATASLIVLFFGAVPGSGLFDRLQADFRRLGPFGLVWNLKEPQHRAFADLRSALREELTALRRGDASVADECVLAQLAVDGDVDETMLGNVIYMVEMGRQDIQVFFRWLLRYAAANPDALARIADETAVPTPGSAMSAAEAFVLEVLRSDQSERLMRRVTREIVFDGYLIPKDAFVRICLWEAHHDTDVFADPYRFDPERFRHLTPTKEQFSPFGLDHHQCPFASLSIGLGTTLLRGVAVAYDITIVDDATPVRGAYHWEPSRRLRLRVASR